jgi:MSHA biogenesis protein MshL
MLRSRLPLIILTVGVTLSVLGCTSKDRQDVMDKGSNYTMQDRELKYTRDDYRNAMAPHPVDKSDSLDNIPQLAPVVAQDKKNNLPQPLVSITVNQDVPIRDIFYELAKQAEVDLELDPTITGSIIFTAYNRPFDQVVERICDMSGLRYKFKDNVLRVERDTPYMKTYRVGYISMQRNYTSSIKSNTSAAQTPGASGATSGGSNGATSSIDIKSSTDFWDEFSKNLTQIIDTTNQQVALTDQSAPITVPNAIPQVTPGQLANVNQPNGAAAVPPSPAGTPGTAGSTAAGATTPNGAPVPMNVATGQPVSPPVAAAPVMGSSSSGSSASPVAGLANPTGGNSAVASGSGASGGASGAQTAYFSVNQQAGLVNVFATEKQHEKIQSYITQLMKAVNTQVLIEAKVFEVDLNDDNRLGIDWSAVSKNLSLTNSFDVLNFQDTPITKSGGVFALSSGDLNATISAISRFGTVRALASPRLSVMNNQTAVLNVSESRVYFKLTIDRTEGTSTSVPTTDITSEINSVPEGVIITVHPSVDPETNEITMNLRPSITRVIDTVNDPAVTIAAAESGLSNLQSPVPELSVREIDSVVKMNSGKTIIMGGLMQDRTEGTQQAIPVLGEIPVLGNLFRSSIDSTAKTEMVIMLKATVMGAPLPDETDKDLYEKMGQDRHPFKL